MAETLEESQRRLCRSHGAPFEPPSPGSKVGIAMQTLGRVPVQGVRIPATPAVCGWYIYAGDEWSDDVNFYQPMCVEHLAEYCPLALPFLGLPPGWRFLTDEQGYVDVWFDEAVLKRG